MEIEIVRVMKIEMEIIRVIGIEIGVEDGAGSGYECIRMNSRSHTFNTKDNYVPRGIETKSSVKTSI
jgi:hypothetical protein